MLVSTPGILGGVASYPPAGTWLSSVCSGPNAHDQGNANYFDSQGTLFNGMFTLWEQFADGSGGSYWTNIGDNSTDGLTPPTSCWYPAYFYTAYSSWGLSFHWYGCGSDGDFEYGSAYSYTYANGDGTETSGGGGGFYGYPAGYLIYDNGSGCCYVYYDGASGYYVSDSCGGGGGCDPYGTYLGSGCIGSSGYDASGQYWSNAWDYGDFYADGSCGSYATVMGSNSNGCYYPSGYWHTYNSGSSSVHWSLYDSCGTFIADGDFTYYSWYNGDKADGMGGINPDGGSWQAMNGEVFSSGTFFDPCASTYYNYDVCSDGGSGYYINLY